MKVEQTCLLDSLQSLLEDQVELFRKSNFRAVEALAEKAEPLVREIAETKLFQQPKFDERRKRLIKSYKTLELMVEAGKVLVEKQLKQVAQGKKMLRKYHNAAYVPANFVENDKENYENKR